MCAHLDCDGSVWLRGDAQYVCDDVLMAVAADIAVRDREILERLAD